MNPSLLPLLRCPFCKGDLKVSGEGASEDDVKYGTLKCVCAEYPVVNGIPILKQGVVGTSGQTVEEIVGLVKAGQRNEALLSLVLPSLTSFLSPSWRRLLKRSLIRRIARSVHKRTIAAWGDDALKLLLNPQSTTACEFLQHYFFNRNAINYQYFAYRFCNGKHLVGLSLAASLLQKRSKPVLDLACGAGSMTWYMQQRATNFPVVGLDDSFFILCVAKNWTAPEAQFVCCLGDGPLPFHEGSFSGVFCSDAFPHFKDKTACIAELRRITGQDGVIVLNWMRNGLIDHPYRGAALPPNGYAALVAEMPHRLVADREILARYLDGLGPPLARPAKTVSLEAEPVVTLVASHREELFEDYGKFDEWPHAQGPLSFNPLYVKAQENGTNEVSLRRTFPSRTYAELNAECKSYLPEEIKVPECVFTDLARGKQTTEIVKLIDQLVVVGTPKKYGSPSFLEAL